MNNSTVLFNGAAWMFLQTVGMKFISFVSQIILAWILVPEEFGKIALVFTITNISFLVQQFGLQDVLIKRFKSFNLYIPLAKSLTTVVILISIVVTCIAGYLGGIIYNDSEIFNLVLIFAISLPFQAFSLIPITKLKIDLNFKILSLEKVLESFSIQLGIILLALLNFKSYSFVIPPVLIACIRCLVLFYYTRIPLNLSFNLRRWRILFADSFYGFIHALLSRISFQIDYIILGIFATQHIVGVYFMAFTLSVQVIGFISASLPGVLFPGLIHLNKDPNLIFKSIDSIIRIIGVVGAPFAFWQCINAAPLIKIFLSDSWYDAILLVQILSLGMAFRVTSSQWLVPMKIQGKFREISNITLISVIFFALLLGLGTYLFGELGTALSVSLYYFITCPIWLYLGLKNLQSLTFHYVLRYLRPILLAGISFGISYWITFFLSHDLYGRNFYLLSLNTIIPLGIYFYLIGIFCPKEIKLLKGSLITKISRV